AVAGTGFIGPVHVEALRRLGRPVVGLLGSSPERSRDAAARLGVARAYDSLDTLLADPAVTAVHLTTPNHFHYAPCKAALAAGKHVLCEKPLVMTAAETAELVALAASPPHPQPLSHQGERGEGVAAGVCYNVRYYPLNLEARQRIAEGGLGRVFHVTGSYVQD